MAVVKNKHHTKGGKKGAKKKMATGTQGTKIASDGLKGYIFEVSFADLQNDEVAFRKFKPITEDTMIEAHIDVKTTSGYLLHLFCVGFTEKCNSQIWKTTYAQHQGANDLKEVVGKLIPNSIGKDIEKTCQSIYLLHDIFFRKVKVLKNAKCSSSGKVTGHETGAKGEQVQECLKCSLLMTRNKRSYL
ncbi:hypothetical protein FD755_021531 [Muntiacus reevesi]|uniref:40S ribosomal protein S3a n=1 Tax=Muntiacus reevesi TaxID=9886 RepID=A0A5N3W204_MUNRE|nr:hypothetical protein FD755_021531 [Muntiacus reevesi]